MTAHRKTNASHHSLPLFIKSTLCMSILSVINHAYADEAADKALKSKDMEVIEVRGIRSSMAANLDIKRLSSSVVDAITAEDIGKFPDKNVADSLQRVPGVVIDRDGGEGSWCSDPWRGPWSTS